MARYQGGNAGSMGITAIKPSTVQEMIEDSVRAAAADPFTGEIDEQKANEVRSFLANVPPQVLQQILPQYQPGASLYGGTPQLPTLKANLGDYAFDISNPNWEVIDPSHVRGIRTIPEHLRGQYRVTGEGSDFTYEPTSNTRPSNTDYARTGRRPISGDAYRLYPDEVLDWSNLSYDPTGGLMSTAANIKERDDANWFDKLVANVIGPGIIGAGLVGAAGAASGLSGAATGAGQSIGMGAADTAALGGSFAGGGSAAGAAAGAASGGLTQAEMLAAQQAGLDTVGWGGAIEPGAIGFSGLEPGVAEALTAAGVPATEAAAAAKAATAAGAAKGLTGSQILTAAKAGMGALSTLLGGGSGSGLAGVLGALAGGKGGGSGGGMSGAAEDSIRSSTNILNDQYDWFKTKVRPIDNMLADEAMTAGGLADQEAYAGKAAADVAQAYGRIRDQRTRELSGMGVNPASGRFQYDMDGLASAEALAGAGAQNNAREMARDKGYTKRLNVSQIGRGIPSSTASSMLGLANAQNQIGRQNAVDRQNNMVGIGQGLSSVFDLGKGVYDFGKSSGWWGENSTPSSRAIDAPKYSVVDDNAGGAGGILDAIGWNGKSNWDNWLGSSDW